MVASAFDVHLQVVSRRRAAVESFLEDAAVEDVREARCSACRSSIRTRRLPLRTY